MLLPDEIAKLRQLAKERGVDPEALIAEAEAMRREKPAASKPGEPARPAAQAEQPKLFQYLLPFVTVRQVRQYMGQDEPFPGDAEIASDWARKHPVAGDAAGAGEVTQ